jgi:hypothetical protein
MRGEVTLEERVGRGQDVPAEYHVTGYRYAYINEHPVLV